MNIRIGIFDMLGFPKIDELRRLRKKSGLSQKDLAKVVSISQSAIAKYENGSQMPSYEVATEIFQYLLSVVVINEPSLDEVKISSVVYLNPNDTLEMAIKQMKKYSISQIPIKSAGGKIIGTITESIILELLSQYHNLDQFKKEEIDGIMDDPLPILPGNCKITEVSFLLRRYGAILVSDSGTISGIVTKSDLLEL